MHPFYSNPRIQRIEVQKSPPLLQPMNTAFGAEMHLFCFTSYQGPERSFGALLIDIEKNMTKQ